MREYHQVPFAPSAGATTAANVVVALPVARGTRNVGVPQSYTRGFRALRLATVRPHIHALFFHTQIIRPKSFVTRDARGLS